MAAIDPCVTPPVQEFFNQNKLLADTEDYDYTRSFIVYATSARTGVLTDDLVVNVMPVNEAEDGLGTPKGVGTTWQDQLKKLLTAQIPPLPRTSGTLFPELGDFISLPIDRERTSLDFTLRKKTCVLVRLIGGFWGFSRTMAPVTTKHEYNNKQYYNLGKHRWNSTTQQVETPTGNMDYNCVSFFSKAPCGDSDNIQHGLSFNVELIMVIGNKEERLPITIDPDVENKGGG